MTPHGTIHHTADPERGTISVRQLHEHDLATADGIIRLAFGTFMGTVDPASFMGDASYVRTRWKADPAAAFAVEFNNEVVGSNFAANQGSVGFFRSADHPARLVG